MHSEGQRRPLLLDGVRTEVQIWKHPLLQDIQLGGNDRGCGVGTEVQKWRREGRLSFSVFLRVSKE